MDPYDIQEAFAAIEEELTASMIRNMKRHHIEEISEKKQWVMWQALQLEALERYKKGNWKKFRRRFSRINAEIDRLIREANARGYLDQEKEILEAIKNGFQGYQRASHTMQGQFFKLNERKLEALVKATTDDMEKAETAVLRMADDQYRKTIYNAQVYANTGAGTYEKAVDMATKDMLSAGLNCIVFANGARHTLEDYADMALRTASKRAYLQGEGTKRQEWGIPTVIMNKRSCPCPKCLPFVGKVLIDDVWSGGAADGKSRVTGRKYPLMSSAITAGLYHPRCKDVHTTYFEGISTPPDDKYTKEELDQIAEDYRREQKQQYAGRQEKRLGRMARHSLDPENKQLYKDRAAQWGKQVEKSADGGIIKKNGATLMMNLQLFAESDVPKQGSGSLKRAIRKFERRIKEHEEYLLKPEEHCSDWSEKTFEEQEGLKRHWRKEIRNFHQSIEDRVKELKKRGDYDD